MVLHVNLHVYEAGCNVAARDVWSYFILTGDF